MAGALGQPIKVAIVGSGPSAFYSAARLLSAKQDHPRVAEVHMYERLPTPNGLVRYGVAPDHPEVKNVEHKFAQVAQDPRFRFFGNVHVVGGYKGGRGEEEQSSAAYVEGVYDYPLATRLTLSHILPHYTHLLLAYGCSHARALGIPGSEPGQLANVHAALDFVNWYNGHPAAHDPAFLQREPWRRVMLDEQMRHATVVGAGNVALDVARILLRSRTTLSDLFNADSALKARAALRATDVPESVLQTLSQSLIDRVDIVARRGPAQVAFTNKELREMMELQDVAFVPPKDDYMRLANVQVGALEQRGKGLTQGEEISSAEQQAAASEARVRKRLLGIVEKGSKATKEASVAQWSMDFFKSPNAFLGTHDSTPSAVRAISWDEMEFERVPSTSDREAPWSGADLSKLRSTGRQSETSTDLVISSVGYKATPLEGCSDDIVPWDAKKGIVPNWAGQVVDQTGKQVPGMYVSGWLARGPVGVIASTRIDANSVVEQMLGDWISSKGLLTLNKEPLPGAPKEVQESSKKVVSWQDWLRIDAEELERGRKLGKLREKIVSVSEMLQVAS